MSQELYTFGRDGTKIAFSPVSFFGILEAKVLGGMARLPFSS